MLPAAYGGLIHGPCWPTYKEGRPGVRLSSNCELSNFFLWEARTYLLNR